MDTDLDYVLSLGLSQLYQWDMTALSVAIVI